MRAVTIPVALTMATAVLDDRHVAWDVTVDVELSTRTASAVNCDDDPIAGGVPTTVTVVTAGPDGAEGAEGVDGSDEQAHSAASKPTTAVHLR